MDFLRRLKQRILEMLQTDLVGLTLFLLIFLLIPTFITIYLFGSPLKRQNIPIFNFEGKDYPLTVNEKLFARDFLSRLFKTKIGLEQHDLCLQNRNSISINGRVLNRKERELDPEGGALQLIIIESSQPPATTSLYAKIGENDCKTINVGEKPILKLQQTTFRRPEKYPATIVVGGNATSSSITGTLHMTNSKSFVQTNRLAWLLKLLGIMTIWSAFVVAIRKLLEIVGPHS